MLAGEFVLTLPLELTYTTADAEAGHRVQTFTAISGCTLLNGLLPLAPCHAHVLDIAHLLAPILRPLRVYAPRAL